MGRGKFPSIGVVTFPLLQASVPALSNLLDILRHLSDKLYLVTGNAGAALVKKYEDVEFRLVEHKAGANQFSRIVKFIHTQMRMSLKVTFLARKVNLWLFFLGETGLILPMLSARATGRPVVLCLAASGIQMSQAQRDPLRLPLAVIAEINLALANRIIVYSERLIKEWGLQKYRSKISIARTLFVDINKFRIEQPLAKRDCIVGYIGRFSAEKGVMNFIDAIPQVNKLNKLTKFIIIGDGALRPRIVKTIRETSEHCKVELAGWIAHEKLPHYLNQLKLLVIPSYTEAGPLIMLEAMACGTPTLATPVGIIPEVIKDGKTGFLTADNSPGNIARNIVRALNHPDLDQIAQNARSIVEKEFSYQNAVEDYRRLFT